MKEYGVWVSAGSSLLGAIIGAAAVLIGNHLKLRADARKESQERAWKFTIETLYPELYAPLLNWFYIGQRQFEMGRKMEWPISDMRRLLQEKRFLVLMSPVPVQQVLVRLDKHLHSTREGFSEEARAQRIRETLCDLEQIISMVYSSYRLEGPNSGKKVRSSGQTTRGI